jgi:hypothetical protein
MPKSTITKTKAIVTKKTKKAKKRYKDRELPIQVSNCPVYPDHANPLERFPSPIKYVAQLKCLASADHMRFSGLTRTLFHCFYPNASPEQISFVGKQRRQSKRNTGIDNQHPIEDVVRAETKGTLMAAKAAALENARTIRAKAMAQGNMVDHQCNAIINNTPVGNTTNLPCRADQLRARVALMLRFGKNPAEIPMLGIHPLVWNFFFYMDQRGFSPSAAQVGVVDRDIGIATMCDQIWRHRSTGYHVLIELKKWETINYEVCIGKMAEPYAQINNNHKSHHQLQLAFSLAMFEKTFNFRMKAAYVVRLHSSGVCVYPLYPWVLSSSLLSQAMKTIQHFLAPTREPTQGNHSRSQDIPCTKGKESKGISLLAENALFDPDTLHEGNKTHDSLAKVYTHTLLKSHLDNTQQTKKDNLIRSHPTQLIQPVTHVQELPYKGPFISNIQQHPKNKALKKRKHSRMHSATTSVKNLTVHPQFRESQQLNIANDRLVSEPTFVNTKQHVIHSKRRKTSSLNHTNKIPSTVSNDNEYSTLQTQKLLTLMQ